MAKKHLDTETGEITEIEMPFTPIGAGAPFWKTPWNHDRDAESLSTALTCKDPSLAQQQFKKDSDINEILRKFHTTGDPSILNASTPKYMDVEKEFDLQENMVTAWEVEQAWRQLPKEAQAILQTPQRFLEWYDKCVEEGNLDGLREIGLVPPEKPQEPPKAPPGGTPAPGDAKAPPAPAGGDNVTAN